MEVPLTELAAGEFRVFVVGCERSGTTLLRLMLDGNAQLSIPPESHFVPSVLQAQHRNRPPDLSLVRKQLVMSKWFSHWNVPVSQIEREWVEHPPSDTSEAVRAVFRCYARPRGKKLFGDKTPWYGLVVPTLAHAFPEARFVHIVRDGRDVALSFLDGIDPLPTLTVPAAAARWRRRIIAASVAGEALGPHRYREVRYEDLLHDPEAVLRELCAFLGLDFSPQMLHYASRGRDVVREYPALHKHVVQPPIKGIRNWQVEMSERDQQLFEALAGDVLRKYRYPLGGGPASKTDRAKLHLRATGLRALNRWQAERRRVVRAASRLRQPASEYYAPSRMSRPK